MGFDGTDVINRMKKFINQRGVTQREFGRRAGVDQDYVCRWISRKKKISENMAKRVDAYLKSEGY